MSGRYSHYTDARVDPLLEKLRELLVTEGDAAGLTPTAVAEEVGIPPATLRRFAGGEGRPTIDTIVAVAAWVGYKGPLVIR